MNKDLTNENFWAEYWSKLQLPVKVDLNFKNDRVIATEILKSVIKTTGMTALEIGCAPGKWLSFLAKELECSVTGIEYVTIAAEKTVQNLDLQQIKDYNIITGNFFSHGITTTFDIVISLGFIEHFDHYEKVLEDQLKLVSPNGYLIVGIPRFKGINFYLQKGIDPFIHNKLLPSHNLNIMNLKIFEKFAKSHNLKILSNNFIGGFEPGLFPVAEIENIIVRIFFKIFLRIFNFLFGKVNSSFISSYQISIYQK